MLGSLAFLAVAVRLHERHHLAIVNGTGQSFIPVQFPNGIIPDPTWTGPNKKGPKKDEPKDEVEKEES